MNKQPDEFADIQRQLHETHGALPDSLSAHQQVADAAQKLGEQTSMIPSYEEYLRDLETPPPSPDFETSAPSVELPFPSNGSFTLENPVTIGQREVARNAEVPVVADILGVVTFESTNEHYQVLKLPDGTVVLGKLKPDGSFKLLTPEHSTKHHVSQHTSRGDLSVTEAEHRGAQRVTIRFGEAPSNSKRANPHLLLAEETKRIDVVKEQSEERRHKKTRRMRRMAQAAFVALTIGLSLAPGGLADTVMDPFVHADTVVAGAELASGRANENHKAGEVVSGLLNDLDNHNYDAVKHAANTYREQHPDAFIKSSTLEQINQSIANATSSHEVEAALRPAHEYYGYNFVVSKNIPLDAAKYTAEQIVAALSTIPKDLLNDAKLEVIGINSAEEINAGAEVGPKDNVEGYYDYDEQGIHIKVNTALGEDISRLSTPVGVSNGSVVQETFDHEFGHALSEGLPGVLPVDTPQLTGDTSGDNAHDFFIGGILGMPSVISSYARTDSDENRAENISGILSQRRDGLAWPDDSRAFSSESNRSLVATLIAMEKLHPGIAAPLLLHRFADQVG